MTTERDLIQRLTERLDHLHCNYDLPSQSALIAEALDYLIFDQPEPEGPTVMEIIALADEIEAEGLGQVDLVRRALTRWGRPAIQPEPEYPSDKELLEASWPSPAFTASTR